MQSIRDVFTYSRAIAFVGWLTMVWGVLEAGGVFTNVPEPWAAVVSVIGGTLAWLGRSGLATAKAKPPEPPPEF